MMLTAGIEADDGKSNLGRPCAVFGAEPGAGVDPGVITPELSVGSLIGGAMAAAPIVAGGPAPTEGGWFMAIGGC